MEKPTILFFTVYLLLMVSLIYFGMTSKIELSKPKNEVSSTFSKELAIQEEKRVETAEKEKGNDAWKPSNTFVITAISLASVLDVVIIIIWARHENRKREGQSGKEQQQARLTDRKWFWNTIAMGIVQPKEGRIVLNPRNLVFFIIVMVLLKFVLGEKLLEG